MDQVASRNDLDIIAKKIIDFCKSHQEGVQDDELSKILNIPEELRINILNQLVQIGYIKLFETQDNTLVYKYHSPEEAQKFAGLSQDSMHVYQLLQESRSNGLTNAELKDKSNYPGPKLQEVLKELEKRNFIKSVKSIHQKNKKIWMLFDIEPTKDIIWDKWYINNDFNKNLVDAIYVRALQYVEERKSANKSEIGISLRAAYNDLKDENIQSIINLLFYDDKIQELPSQMKSNPVYKISEWEKSIKSSVFTLIPCGSCPVFSECREGGIISPEKCIYLHEW